MAGEGALNLKATELRLGLPGTTDDHSGDGALSTTMTNKRASPEKSPDYLHEAPPAPKAHIVGWPPVRSYRKNNSQVKTESESGIYVKVSMDGAPYLRKIDLIFYNGYKELIRALGNMFNVAIGEYLEREGYKGSEYAPAYEDKDGDLMLVGDVPWDMFMSTCKRLRIMKGTDAKGLSVGSTN